MTLAHAKPAPTYSILTSEGRFTIGRDGVPIKTPLGAPLSVPTQKLAQGILKEWQSQKEKIIPASMPLTQLAATAIDIVGKDRLKIVEQVMAYIDAELLCHRAEEPNLAQRQKDIWQPLLEWCAKTYGTFLQTGTGVMPVRQKEDAKKVFEAALTTYDALALTGLRQAAEVSGSLVLALALKERHLTAMQVFEAAELDVLFQTEKWGKDPVTDQRLQAIEKDLALCEKWFDLCQKTD